jgi:hypothetical protein
MYLMVEVTIQCNDATDCLWRPSEHLLQLRELGGGFNLKCAPQCDVHGAGRRADPGQRREWQGTSAEQEGEQQPC